MHNFWSDIASGHKPSRVAGAIESASPGERGHKARVLRMGTNEMETLGERSIKSARRGHAPVVVGSSKSRGMVRSASSADTFQSENVPLYNPIFSNDFFEIPYESQERRQWFRHFYQYDPLVGRAIDLLTHLPLSKFILQRPESTSEKKSTYVLRYFERALERIGLFRHSLEATHEYWLLGNHFTFAEDGDGFDPDDGFYDDIPKSFKSVEEKRAYFHKRFGRRSPGYKGWERLITLPIDQVAIQSYEFSDHVDVQYVPADTTRSQMVQYGLGSAFDMEAGRLSPEYTDIPEDLMDSMSEDGLLQLSTDPYEGSAVFHLARKKSSYDDWGVSIVDRVLKDLIFRDKLRQIQTLIANRRMTPIRILWAEDLDETMLMELREHVDIALQDPDYSIVVNYQLNWEEMGSNDRLLQLESEWEHTKTNILTGLGMTEELITGSSSYGGNRITLEVMNTEFLLFREIFIKEFIEEFLFKPMAAKKGFVDVDEFGNEVLIYPRVRFARLSIKDSESYYDLLFNLYAKGSLSPDVIYDMLNIDPVDAKQKVERDLLTVNDSQFNELPRGLYGEVARALVEEYDVTDKFAKYLGFTKKEAESEPGGEDAFASARFSNLRLSSKRRRVPKARSDKHPMQRSLSGHPVVKPGHQQAKTKQQHKVR